MEITGRSLLLRKSTHTYLNQKGQIPQYLWKTLPDVSEHGDWILLKSQECQDLPFDAAKLITDLDVSDSIGLAVAHLGKIMHEIPLSPVGEVWLRDSGKTAQLNVLE